jgi:hypothetical protein
MRNPCEPAGIAGAKVDGNSQTAQNDFTPVHPAPQLLEFAPAAFEEEAA